MVINLKPSEFEFSNLSNKLKINCVLDALEKDEQFLVVDADEIKKRYSKALNFSDILWYITRVLKERYSHRVTRPMKISVECDFRFLEIQIPIFEEDDELDDKLDDEFFNLSEEAGKIYGPTAHCFFLVSSYEKY
ncbi:hypothetical protein MsAg5_17310 [Methanosarcinaceae archaeon Ag5]|uniref:Uncharacterized protein n=1 Tax=Methanolapillus africanus TaxID=3028297 RepID=A0AAE4MKX0_9EURY|nr:hypothetical protein [Methanosarcinaceae archaeon Ag5]